MLGIQLCDNSSLVIYLLFALLIGQHSFHDGKEILLGVVIGNVRFHPCHLFGRCYAVEDGVGNGIHIKIKGGAWGCL